MNINEEDLKSFLINIFDVGFNQPLEMMEQEITKQFEHIQSKFAPPVSSIDKWGFTDYLNAINNPEPWILEGLSK